MIGQEDIESVWEFVRQVSHDKARASHDLQVLAEQAIIQSETDGRTKSPRLTQEYIVVELLV